MENYIITRSMFKQVLNLPDSVALTCKTFGHPEFDSCRRAILKYMVFGFIGNAKYFAPIYLVQAATQWRKLKTRNGIIILFKNYLRTVVYAMSFVTVFSSTFCVYQQFGRVDFNSLYVAGFLCGLTIYMESLSNQCLHTLTLANTVVEGFINSLEYHSVIKRTRWNETFAFMLCTSTIMWLRGMNWTKPRLTFWFFWPKITDEKRCEHSNCTRNAFNNFKLYFSIGYGIEIVKFLLGSAGKLLNQPKLLLSMLFRWKNVQFGLVTGGFATIYNLMICAFRKREGKLMPWHYWLAGLVSGATYSIKPNIQFWSTAFIATLHMFVSHLSETLKIDWNLRGLLFAFCTMYLMPLFFLSPPLCPKYVKNMVYVTTNGYVSAVKENFRKFILLALVRHLMMA